MLLKDPSKCQQQLHRQFGKTQNRVLGHQQYQQPTYEHAPVGCGENRSRICDCRSIGVFDKNDTDDNAKHEREEEEHAQGIARHDVFGMSIKAKDVGDEGDVRAMDTSMKVSFL